MSEESASNGSTSDDHMLVQVNENCGRENNGDSECLGKG